MQNDQCVVNVGGSSATGSGDDLTVIFSVHFRPAFQGPTTLAVTAKDWDNWGETPPPLPFNTWTVEESHTPVALSMTPAIGTGSLQVAQEFTYYFYHPDGAASITNTATSIAGHPTYSYQGCYHYFDAASVRIGLADDDGGNWVAWPLVGVTGQLPVENSQCTVNPEESSVAVDRAVLTLALEIEFKPVYAGFQFHYMAVNGGISATAKPRGLWVIPGYVAPEVISLSPSAPPSGPSGSQDFQFSVSDTAGGDTIRLVQFSMTPEGQTFGCKPVIYPKLSRIFLLNNTETGWVNNAGIEFGDGTVSDSHSYCAVSGVSVSVPTPPDISCTVNPPGSPILTCSNVPFTASTDPPPFEGTMTTHVTAVDIGNLAATQQMGTWAVETSLPSVWKGLNVNPLCSPNPNGVTYNAGKFTVTGAGSPGLSGTADSFEFVPFLSKLAFERRR